MMKTLSATSAMLTRIDSWMPIETSNRQDGYEQEGRQVEVRAVGDRLRDRDAEPPGGNPEMADQLRDHRAPGSEPEQEVLTG